MILKCVCTHDVQDKLHGQNMRVFNPVKHSTGEQPKYRCTVCQAVKGAEGNAALSGKPAS